MVCVGKEGGDISEDEERKGFVSDFDLRII